MATEHEQRVLAAARAWLEDERPPFLTSREYADHLLACGAERKGKLVRAVADWQQAEQAPQQKGEQ